MLAVSDTGSGMADDVCEQIFEPFYSTKGELGTGLGLATVYGIVKQHGGNIWVYSELDVGTTFKIYLPVSVKSPEPLREDEAPPLILEGCETILLAEDNEDVRSLAARMLRHWGYTVLATMNGTEALAVLKAHDGSVDLLLTDVIMPEMSGPELFKEVTEENPDIKVLYMSGYTDDMIAHRGVLDQGIAFIQKPFTSQAIAAKVREALTIVE